MRHLLYIVGMIGVSALIMVFMVFGEIYWLSEQVVPLAGIKLPEWLDNFKLWAAAGIYAAALISIFWYVLNFFFLNFNEWNKNYRPIWIGLFCAAVIPLALLGILLTKQTNEGAWWAYLFYITNNVGVFYLATALFSPPSVMYIPLGARYIRSW